MGKAKSFSLPGINNFQKYKNHLAIAFVLVFAALQFVLILRHKSPFLSDSYMYLHQFYQFKGDTFQDAYKKVTGMVNLQNSDEIEKNIFTNEQAYKNSYTFFEKRPLFPLVSSALDQLLNSQYLSMIIPPFVSYLGLFVVIYNLVKNSLTRLFATATVMLLASFYPYLDYSTYFLTDTIGAFFWFLLLFLVFKFTETSNKKWVVLYLEVFVLSLLNREQPVLFVIILALSYVFISKSKFTTAFKKNIRYLLALTLILSMMYFSLLQIFGARSLKETISYTQNRYGLYDNTYSNAQTVKYLVNSAIRSHKAAAIDLYRHHLWFAVFAISTFGVLGMFFRKTKKNIVDILMLTSALASYSFVFIFPDFSWRYYYPAIIGIIYFAARQTEQYFGLKNETA